jgi:hypothetical protein
VRLFARRRPIHQNFPVSVVYFRGRIVFHYDGSITFPQNEILYSVFKVYPFFFPISYTK